jgi:hypothetical protein
MKLDNKPTSDYELRFELVTQRQAIMNKIRIRPHNIAVNRGVRAVIELISYTIKLL